MRLIDADALLDKLLPIASGLAHEYGSLGGAVSGVMRHIEAAQTIDAIPVVRCKDCKHGYPCGDEIVCYHPEYELAEGKWSYKKDFFCAFGDTKEGDDNG